MMNRKKGSATGDLMFFVAFVLAIAVAWIVSGGPSRSPLAQGPSLVGLKSFDTSVEDRVFSLRSFFAPLNGTSRIEDTFGRAVSEFDRIQKELGETGDFGEVSPYWGRVSITKNSSGPQESSVDKEYIELNILFSAREPINITGWKLQSMISNRTVTIGEATKVSTSGNVNIEQAILASPRDRIYVRTGRSPIGTSFQINKCSGYFGQFQEFTPRIQNQCPTPEEELAFAESNPANFGDECLDYIEGLPRCEMPLNAIPGRFPNACHIFITEKINYNSCVENHRNDDDFFKPEWRVYLKSDSELWQKRREIIRLLDENGKTVDVFSYN